ncbi:MAG TPA: hypothetical protein VK628_02135 [Flavitalea sp.]|nr:hypothetical protein [Flavitalea sp.]
MRILLVIFGLVLTTISCKKESDKVDSENVIVFQASGNITAEMDEFRQTIGGNLNSAPGASDGRREIDWDGVPDELLEQDLPLDFFNPTAPESPAVRQRGLVYPSGAGAAGFQVSNNSFAAVNSQASPSFNAFSGANTFANVRAKAWDMKFQVPGKNIDASVKAFGLVLSGVDLPNSTSLEFFNGSKSLGKFFAPAHDSSSSFSFLGVYFKNEKVTSITVNHQGILIDGEADISDGGSKDLIVLDDFVYSEPIE